MSCAYEEQQSRLLSFTTYLKQDYLTLYGVNLTNTGANIEIFLREQNSSIDIAIKDYQSNYFHKLDMD